MYSIPIKLRQTILYEMHDSPISGHVGYIKTYQKVKERFYWNNIEQSIRRYVANCKSCQLRKSSNESKGLLQNIQSKEPFEICGLDIVGPFTETKKNNKYIIVFIDLFTKWLECKAVKNIQAKTIADWLVNDIFLKHGYVKKIITDNARNFTSNLMKEMFNTTKIEHKLTTPYNPQCNGQAEKACGIVTQMLTHYIDESFTNWDEVLPKIVFGYNTSQQTSTKLTPFELLYGREAKFPIEITLNQNKLTQFSVDYVQQMIEAREYVRINTIDAQERQKFLFDTNRKDITFKVGDKVALKNKLRVISQPDKFQPKYSGPFEVTKVISDLVYQIKDLNFPRRKEKKANIRNLKRWNEFKINEINNENADNMDIDDMNANEADIDNTEDENGDEIDEYGDDVNADNADTNNTN